MSIEQELREAAKPINGWAKPGRADLMLRAADELHRLMGENEKLRADLAFADEQAVKVEALLEPHIKWECASDGCGKRATVHFERGGIGSYYCRECYMRVQALPARALSEREGQDG